LLEGCPIVTPVPRHLLLACGAFGPRLPPERVAAAIARGVERAGGPAPDVLALEAGGPAPDLLALEAAGPAPDVLALEAGGGAADVLALEAGGGAADALAADRAARDLPTGGTPQDARALLDALGFDARMRRARAVVVVWGLLRERTLAGSVTFEIATRARQGGVPAYAVTAANELRAFDARMLDLQLIVRARGAAGLAAAGEKLAGLA
jgi:glycerate 2-kinase